MKPCIPLATLLIAATLVGCSSSSKQSMSLPLAATHNNPGHIANTTLTGVGNRRSMDERLVQALAASARSGFDEAEVRLG